MNELQTQTQDAGIESYSVAEVSQQVVKIKQLMTSVMVKDQHYGTIPGCGDKPTLLKAGAEKVNFMFRFAADDPAVVMRELSCGHREYEVHITLRNAQGRVVGCGVGSCSTMESKYRYRNSERTCPKCNAPAIKKSKFPPKKDPGAQPGWYCYAKVGGCGAEFAADDPTIVQQEAGKIDNPDIADQYNTCLKMAKKRAYIDATLTASAASDFFTQDIEDLERRAPRDTEATVVSENRSRKPEVRQPTLKTGAEEPFDAAKETDSFLTKIAACESVKELALVSGDAYTMQSQFSADQWAAIITAGKARKAELGKAK
jgi:hypothetical protein